MELFTEDCQNTHSLAEFFIIEKSKIDLNYDGVPANFYKFPVSYTKVIDKTIEEEFDSFYCLKDSLSFKFTPVTTLSGIIYKYRLSGVIPKIYIDRLKAFYKIVNKKFHIQLKDVNGTIFYLGNKDAGMTLQIDGSTNTNHNQIAFVFKGMFTETPYIYDV